MQEINYAELIAKQLKGETSVEENRLIAEWIKEAPINKEIADQFKTVWTKTKIDYTVSNSDQVFDKIMMKLNTENQRSLYVQEIKIRRKRQRFFSFGIAAVIILLVVTSISIYSIIRNDSFNITPEVALQHKSIPKGQKMKIFLPDGSVVWLNAESEIIYPERFENKNRVVSLTGEAYFDVARDTAKPFIVKTHDLEVVVLGTTFNVRSFGDEKSTAVALESGKVLIEPKAENLGKYILSPGEGLKYDLATGSINQFKVDHKITFDWKDGVIYFKDANLNEVISRLSRWYGVEFIVENYNGNKWEYSAEFKNENLNNVLMTISFSKGFNYQIDQNKVKIVFN